MMNGWFSYTRSPAISGPDFKLAGNDDKIGQQSQLEIPVAPEAGRGGANGAGASTINSECPRFQRSCNYEAEPGNFRTEFYVPLEKNNLTGMFSRR